MMTMASYDRAVKAASLNPAPVAVEPGQPVAGRAEDRGDLEDLDRVGHNADLQDQPGGGGLG